MAGAYYNEKDAFAANWLRNLIMLDVIAPGDVDERSIEDVSPDDLRGYDQHHFFAGIGVWSAALRGAGWPDDRPVWTGSCPCQPFSAAGKGGGFADERHLWPAWHWLIRQHRPDVVFGEQVASKPGLDWFDLVSADLEAEGYAVAPADLCAAGLGAPHIRQRLYFVANAGGGSLRHGRRGSAAGAPGEVRREVREQRLRPDDTPGGDAGPVVDTAGEQAGFSRRTWESGGAGQLGDDDDDARLEGRPVSAERGNQLSAGSAGVAGVTLAHGTTERFQAGSHEPASGPEEEEPQRRGHWVDVDWIPCRDGKWRPVEPGTFPLAHGAPARVGRLRGYGNAIVKPVAEAFIAASMAAMS